MLWEMTRVDWMVSFAFACTACFICGWIADRILDHAGFGIFGNWLLLLLGAYLGLYAYNLMGNRLNWYPMFTMATGFGGGTAFLLAIAAVKSAVRL